MNGMRAIAAALMMAALIGVFSPAAAQESEGEAGADAASSIYVGVSCAVDDVSGTSTCDFAPVDQAGGAVYGLSIPSDNLCAPITDAGVGTLSESGVYAALPDGVGSLSITLQGEVSAGGAAVYGVDTDAGQFSIGGDGIVCDGAELVDPGATTDDHSDESVIDDSLPPADEPVTTLDEEGGEEGAAVDEIPVPDVTVSVLAYDCTIDPSGADPATLVECTPSAGVELSATADGADEGLATTDANGAASFSVPDGSALVVAENTSTIPTGFAPYGNGVANVTAEAGGAITFIHLSEPIVGRLQIVNGSCPTSGESRTEFRVIEPRSVAMADAPECEATGGTVFTILGGTLGDGGISVVTGDDGAWRGYLPAGTYTVVDDSSESAEVTVIVDDISVVVVVDYISHPIGVLNVSRFTCDDAEQAGIEISFFGTEPTVGDDDDCAPTDGDVTIDVDSVVSSASVATITLGSDGVEEIELDPGDYVFTDDASGESASFTIEGGKRVFAVVQDLVVSDDGVGEPGGGNPGGGDPGGEDPGNGNPSPDDGTGNPGDGTGNPNAGGPDDNGGEGTAGGVDTGGNGGDSVADVTQLPATGIRDAQQGAQGMLITFLAISSGLAAGAVALKRARRAA